MIFDDLELEFASVFASKCLHSAQMEIWFTNIVIFCSSRKNTILDRKFQQRLHRLKIDADKARFAMGTIKTHFFVTGSIWGSKIVGKIIENMLFCLIFEVLDPITLY